MLDLTIRERGARVVQQDLGHMRSIASQMAYENPGIDEEEVFARMCCEWVKGLKRELIKTIGVEKSGRYLDGFAKRS